ncbi:MAG: presenilin family intramembrane aspartyl protease PSH [Halobacteriota archaeon]|nr:presenilin family intramembrane aspartyl protease PSH [Halobacteriota archaeon]
MLSSEEKMEYLPLIGMATFLVLVQIIALLMAKPFEASGMQAFPEPESILNPLMYVGLILAFTLLILIIIKLDQDWFIQIFILFAVASTMYYVFLAIISNFWISITLAVLLTLFMYLHPEWYIIDIIGVVIGAGVASIFGISLTIIPVLVLLTALAVYDAISVYKTKHMITLAESVMDLKLPILFVLPRRRGYSFIKEADMEKGDAYFMGLGDAIIPSILVVSANFFIEAPYTISFINVLALGTIIGTIAGYSILMFFVGKGKPHAGLPFLNSGAILGFLFASAIYSVGFI